MSLIEPAAAVVAARSDVGRVREANEDACGEFHGVNGSRLFVVADGMGGHRGGATASRVALEALRDSFQTSDKPTPEVLAEAFDSANRQVYQVSADNVELRGMGTTLVTLLLDRGDDAWVGHVGDSRAYRLRAGAIEPLTADHSVVAEMMRRGLLTAEEAAVHPRRNEILRSIGVDSRVEPEMTRVEVQPGDRFLLCSDGLTSLVSDSEIAAVLEREPPSQAVNTLVELANTRGGYDNVTVSIVAIPGGVTTEIRDKPAGMTGVFERSAARLRQNQRVEGIARLVAYAAGAVALALAALVVFSLLR
ncbi:MAG: Stp1/IreP family PP2C-type Ser/Thr phosphatase [Proteobacteria bacterium]|nr:Stp1/IreP family PP2C-type Ser/Thr phosphatase [Pseudomonadota bacterium]